MWFPGKDISLESSWGKKTGQIKLKETTVLCSDLVGEQAMSNMESYLCVSEKMIPVLVVDCGPALSQNGRPCFNFKGPQT